jgi:hypothetical protein
VLQCLDLAWRTVKLNAPHVIATTKFGETKPIGEEAMEDKNLARHALISVTASWGRWP